MMPNLSRQKMPTVLRASLSMVAASHTLRCDAKQAEKRFAEFLMFISAVEHFQLGEFLPKPLLKGAQPRYLETLEPEGIPVINTLAIQQLAIRTEACRYISHEDYDALDEEKRPKNGDVLLTMDGGPSIGKPALFDLKGDYSVDSHVAILRPVGLNPQYLVYLLASPLGQVQFQQAESGASGQTAVTEEDLRRFRFPLLGTAEIEKLVQEFNHKLREIREQTRALREQEQRAWLGFSGSLVKTAKPRFP